MTEEDRIRRVFLAEIARLLDEGHDPAVIKAVILEILREMWGEVLLAEALGDEWEWPRDGGEDDRQSGGGA